MRIRDTVPMGTRSVVVSGTALGGVPAWLIAESRIGTAVETFDSLWVQRGDLAPIRWSARHGRSVMGASFARDSMFAAMESYQGRSSFALAAPPTSLITPGVAERVIELLPLAVGLRAAVSLPVVEVGLQRLLPGELIVEREEHLVIDGRDVECWLVRLTSGTTEQRFWVRKADARIVRSEQGASTGRLISTLRS